jgi:hypothetical protein
MCIIAYSPYGEKIKNSILTNCFLAHQDGAGIMFRCSSGIAFVKGLITVSDLKKRYKEMLAMFPDSEHAIHFRTGTSGIDELGCTHPFPISDCYFELHTLSGIAKRMLMHNGILSHGEDGLSDTQVYVKDILHPMRTILKQKPIQDMIEEHIGDYNKFLIFDKDDSYMLGSWIEDDMFYYTNNDFKRCPRISKWNRKMQYGCNFYEDYKDDWNEKSYLTKWKDSL